MTVYIQRIPAAGIGAKLFPDAAMDNGTRGLIDTVDPWSWGGTLPTSGSTLATGAGPKNYALAEDGWTEDQAAAVTAGYTGNGIAFSPAGALMTMPTGFKPQTSDRRLGLIWWARNSPHPSGTSFNNRLFDVEESGVTRMGMISVYSSTGVIGSLELIDTGCANLVMATGTAFCNAMFDGQLHQFGYEAYRDGAGYMRRKLYLDGALSYEAPAIADSAGAWANTGAVASLQFGRPAYYNGTGLYGRLYRAMMQNLQVTGARSMADTVALDYTLNKSRLTAAAVV